MDMRDPAPGAPWKRDQFWVCPRCGRHFWTTYTAPPDAPVLPNTPEQAQKT
jgi:transposase-like protein